jgi:hypothetical protein
MRPVALGIATALLGALGPIAPALAADAGQIKVSRGTVWIERGGAKLGAQVGTKVREADVVSTGVDGSVGITFADDSLLAIGPGTVLVIERFSFDPTTQAGGFESRLRTGTLSAVSGKLTRQSPESMKVRTPSAVLGVRGTELLVRTGGPLE